jgi:hypothetical protein
MGRQLFQDGPFVDTMLASPTANTTNTIIPLWVAGTFTPIFANDPKAGKIYVVKAGGILSADTATTTLVLTPNYGTGGVALGASIAQKLPVVTNAVWTLEAELIFRVIGAPGANSSAVLIGNFVMQGTAATSGVGTNIPFGGTLVTNLDASITKNIEINTTFSANSNSIQPHFAYIFSRN